MSLFDFLQPKWKHSDPAVRERAVLELERQDLLEIIVYDDPSEQVRLAALMRITDQIVLARFARANDTIALAAMKRLPDRKLVTEVAQRAASRAVREFAVEVLDDRAVLHRIATSDTDPRVRLKARKKHVGCDATRNVIQSELSRLELAQPEPEKTPEFSGTLDELCHALVSDGRFRINGSIETYLPGQATIRELSHGAVAAPTAEANAKSTPAARFLAFKRADSTGPADEAAAREFFEIAVWRTGENTFHGYTEEKRLDMVINPVTWSSVSNGATPGSMPNKINRRPSTTG